MRIKCIYATTVYTYGSLNGAWFHIAIVLTVIGHVKLWSDLKSQRSDLDLHWGYDRGNAHKKMNNEHMKKKMADYLLKDQLHKKRLHFCLFCLCCE